MAQNKSGKSATERKRPPRPGEGRPPKYKTPEELQNAIDKYFKDCEGIKALDDDSNPIITKYGYVYLVEPKPPTMSGLAIALGFLDRSALLNYQAKDEFYHTVRAAKGRVEQYAEMRLFDKDGANGAKFSLANNFRGWRERQDVNLGGGDTPLEVNINVTD